MKNLRIICLMACAVSAGFALGGCGGGGSSPGAESSGIISATSTSIPSTVVDATSPAKRESFYALTEDAYGMQNATFMSAAHCNDALVLRAAIADGISDPNFTSVFRIDIFAPAEITEHGSYAVGGSSPGSTAFPGEIMFFNGHKSTLLATSSGTITFTSYGTKAGDLIAGDFAVLVEDGNSMAVPKPRYAVKGNFGFVVETSGALLPVSSPVPVTATTCYLTKCAACHTLGSIGPSSAEAPDLSLKGGEIDDKYSPDAPGHQNIILSASEMHDLKVLLNAQ